MLSNSRGYNNILAVLMFVVGLAVLLWVTYDFVNRYRPEWLGGDPLQGAKITVASNPTQSPVNYSVSNIVAAHIFGQPVRDKPVIEEAPVTTLKVNLVGVLSSDDEKFARALIRVGSKGTNSYAVGNQVEGTDAKIHRVESARVILDRGGKYEMLAMVREDVKLTRQ